MEQVTTSSSPGVCPGAFGCLLCPWCCSELRVQVTFSKCGLPWPPGPGGGIGGHLVAIFCLFKNLHIFFILAVAHFHSSKRGGRILFPACLFPTFVVCRLFGDGHFEWCFEISCCSLIHSLKNGACLKHVLLRNQTEEKFLKK